MEDLLSQIAIGLMIFLIVYSIYTRFNRVIEGATGSGSTNASQDTTKPPDYKDPGLQNDPLYLATINASNITFLKSQIDGITQLRQQVDLLNEQVENNSTQLSALNTSLQNTGTSSIPPKDQTNEMADSANKVTPVGST